MHSIEGHKFHQYLAPALVIISGHSLVFSRKIITSTGFLTVLRPDASAPVVVQNQSPTLSSLMRVFSPNRVLRLLLCLKDDFSRLRQRLKDLPKIPCEDKQS